MNPRFNADNQRPNATPISNSKLVSFQNTAWRFKYSRTTCNCCTAHQAQIDRESIHKNIEPSARRTYILYPLPWRNTGQWAQEHVSVCTSSGTWLNWSWLRELLRELLTTSKRGAVVDNGPLTTNAILHEVNLDKAGRRRTITTPFWSGIVARHQIGVECRQKGASLE